MLNEQMGQGGMSHAYMACHTHTWHVTRIHGMSHAYIDRRMAHVDIVSGIGACILGAHKRGN